MLKINGREVPAPLLDFGILMYHSAEILAKLECGPYFYLSKVESALEAKLWNDIFTWAEDQLGLQFGTIKSCVLIENILATFEMEWILYELRHHCIGLNCGVWDYSASIISLFGFYSFSLTKKISFPNSSLLRSPTWIRYFGSNTLCQHRPTFFEFLCSASSTCLP